MLKLLSVFGLLSIFLLCFTAALVSAQGSSSRWKTLGGNAPLVIARGGYSGIFPDSSPTAYGYVADAGLKNSVIWCDVQLSKDGVGICFPDVNLRNATNVKDMFPDAEKTYVVNGASVQGWFSVDYSIEDLQNLYLIQRIFSRPPNFDSNGQIMTVDSVANSTLQNELWLHIGHDIFYSRHNLSMTDYIVLLSRDIVIHYLSSPEVGFLRSITAQLNTNRTKLVFQILGADVMEPSTNQTYGSLLSNLTLIKTFASGILVPKYLIWPVASSQYLQNQTSLVLDAHNAGLEVFAYNFANDITIPYDFNYNPVAEYLAYVDNGGFSVDGVLSDFPATATQSIDCYSHTSKNDKVQANISVISSEGASLIYPGCTDKAYEEAVLEGVEILDCPVQMSSDGVPFCLGSIDLRDRTDVVQSQFSNLTTNNPELNLENGIFTYSLTWSQIQSLTPAISNPYANYSLFRNPRAQNDGKLMQLSEFLTYANNATSVSGVIISIEHAAYLAKDQGLGVVDAVFDALTKSGYNNQTSKKIMITSRDISVLSKFQSNGNYELVYLIDEDVRDISNSTIVEIKKVATSVIISKRSVYTVDMQFVTGRTNVVPKLHAFNLSVFVQLFDNEFVSQPYDFNDPYLEINSHVFGMNIDGVITNIPATAAKYKRNRCLGYKELPLYMEPPVNNDGFLMAAMTPQDMPPAQAPNPVLNDSDVTEPPLPPVGPRPGTASPPTAARPTPTNKQPMPVGSTILGMVPFLLATLLVY